MKRLPSVEVYVKQYGIIKQTKQVIGLQTRIIINNPSGNSTVHNFDFQKQAIEFIREKFGDFMNGKYEYINLWNKYGKTGYRWEKV